jgi:hypothetical protein
MSVLHCGLHAVEVQDLSDLPCTHVLATAMSLTAAVTLGSISLRAACFGRAIDFNTDLRRILDNN